MVAFHGIWKTYREFAKFDHSNVLINRSLLRIFNHSTKKILWLQTKPLNYTTIKLKHSKFCSESEIEIFYDTTIIPEFKNTKICSKNVPIKYCIGKKGI